ncbi:ABC transporter ATP-binding protein [Arthrobacter sp. AZCC_0090]|uniref:ABC transporter ATP-binding protein n=1 Tax=Arthrobacter sp. AZCC_0090 TaxID=2735881 RepID=UPI00160ECA32|nr:ATP-binding cassette domain-containing protein [Arthrobacter sp. AZCC_0090]MBB6406609.1 ABC-type glutathione transport system ATPase component [Arthrobacter sp. AZCC_0090]
MIAAPGTEPTTAASGAGRTEPILAVDGLRKTFGRGRKEAVAVDGISFELHEGGSLGIVGESGSGKTTTARMLIGLEQPTAGRILVDGSDLTRPARRIKDLRARGRLIQIVFQDPYTSLDRRQKVGDCLGEVVRLHFGLSGSALNGRVRELGELVGLQERQLRALPRELSGGQRQRVAIARALAAEPKILILDEAVSALDVSIQAQILNLLADIREQRGVSYVFISHDLAVIRQITDTAIVMRHGQVVEQGQTANVLDSPQDPYTRLLRDSVPHAGWQPGTVK